MHIEMLDAHIGIVEPVFGIDVTSSRGVHTSGTAVDAPKPVTKLGASCDMILYK